MISFRSPDSWKKTALRIHAEPARKAPTLMHRPARPHARIELDLPERALVASDILLQQSQQCLGLLRTQIDPLKIADFDLGFRLLLQRTENQKEVPNIDAHLHAVRVAFPVVWIAHQLQIRLRWNAHSTAVYRVLRWKGKASPGKSDASLLPAANPQETWSESMTKT